MNYYNDFDPKTCAWLRELIKAGHLPQGYVDERSITEVTPSDLVGFTQCHFFAGIGGWSYALQLAGVPPTARLWTGSPPCQPFSVAGKQLGQLDERHLAPAFMRLVDQCRPPILFGEQVAAAIGKHWLDDLFTELERQGYACGAAVLPAASVGAPHKRDRLFFGAVGVAQPMRAERDGKRLHGLGESDQAQRGGETTESSGCGSAQRVGYPNDSGPQIGRGEPGKLIVPQGREDAQRPGGLSGVSGELGEPHGEEFRGEPRACDSKEAEIGDRKHGHLIGAPGLLPEEPRRADTNNGFWSDADWLSCRDGKIRPVEPGTFPLANGVPARVGRLRGYGNAIVPQVAAEFIKAFTGACTDAGN